MEAAAAFLAVRSRSVDETRRRLVHLGYPPGIVDQVVERLIEIGYLDDQAFARAWVESRDRARPRGAVALRRELQRKGVPDEVITAILEERASRTAKDDPEGGRADPDRAAAFHLIERRASTLRREPDPRRRRQKAYALLARSGFAPDTCHEVASTVAEDDQG
jgi:regulatory protein